MIRLTARTREGNDVIVEDERGISLMRAIRDAGIDQLLAICGGAIACATCHVYVDPDLAGRLPPISEDEEDLLSGLAHRRPTSRLSCQIPLAGELEGATIQIAPEE